MCNWARACPGHAPKAAQNPGAGAAGDPQGKALPWQVGVVIVIIETPMGTLGLNTSLQEAAAHFWLSETPGSSAEPVYWLPKQLNKADFSAWLNWAELWKKIKKLCPLKPWPLLWHP